MGQQVPSRPTRLHATQAPPQATLQHRPSLQNPDAQSAFFAQTAPRGLGPQLPATHLTPLAQSPSDVHAGKHLFVLLSQLKGAQTVSGPGLQRPVASQTLTLMMDAPSHVPGLHTVPGACLRQAPAPLHDPSRPQVETSALGQTFPDRGGRPFGTNEQVPGDWGVLHALHVSVHAPLQQTPSTQKPLWQSPAQPQAWPFGLRMPFVPLHFVSDPASGVAPSGPGFDGDTPPHAPSAAVASATTSAQPRTGPLRRTPRRAQRRKAQRRRAQRAGAQS
jgi:hypothetical protein